VAVCSGIANSFLRFRHGEVITIFGAVRPTLDELSALWLSCSWICDALALRQGDSSFFCSDFTRISLMGDQVQWPSVSGFGFTSAGWLNFSYCWVSAGSEVGVQ
ncbi:hypothetical protein Tco_1520585, partial [Tanacetum coccineum]